MIIIKAEADTRSEDCNTPTAKVKWYRKYRERYLQLPGDYKVCIARAVANETLCTCEDYTTEHVCSFQGQQFLLL